MKEDMTKYDSTRDLENLLSPGCEFQVSSGFMKKLMRAAQASTHTGVWTLKRTMKLAGAAAVIAGIVSAGSYIFRYDTTTVVPELAIIKEEGNAAENHNLARSRESIPVEKMAEPVQITGKSENRAHKEFPSVSNKETATVKQDSAESVEIAPSEAENVQANSVMELSQSVELDKNLIAESDARPKNESDQYVPDINRFFANGFDPDSVRARILKKREIEKEEYIRDIMDKLNANKIALSKILASNN